ncbi:MAG: response regulator receiver protein [Rhizobacter sp.]|nr:response regulator receiver protein [Rhizobacter sp.]
MPTSRILIVEDQADIRKLIRLTLSSRHWETFEASSGEEGLEQIRSLRPDLVLLDVMMPGLLDGFDVCERVRKDPELSGIPVVLLTAHGQASDIERGKLVGANGYLTKPFSPLKLIDMVSSML